VKQMTKVCCNWLQRMDDHRRWTVGKVSVTEKMISQTISYLITTYMCRVTTGVP